MVNDVTSPVATARYYAYICLGAHEMLHLFPNDNNQSFSTHLINYPKIILADSLFINTDKNLSLVLCLTYMTIHLLPSGYLMTTWIDSLENKYLSLGGSQSHFLATETLVKQFILQFNKYIQQDGFKKLSAYKKYTPLTGKQYWQPTGPGFLAAIEPNWQNLRPFFLESLKYFKIQPPIKYSESKQSSFYKLTEEVFQTVNKNDSNLNFIADFWDCNPYKLYQLGHVEFGLKKISPAGHWMGITGILSLQNNLNLYNVSNIHSLVAMALSDAFIVCWKEKYSSNRLRPEQAIRNLFDPTWKPYLQSPPFPEYVSGHSVISNTAAEILTIYFGDNIEFVDNTELEFNIPLRKFSSFKSAAAEASRSRLYGGIHFRDAVEQGAKLGIDIGNYIINKTKLKKNEND